MSVRTRKAKQQVAKHNPTQYSGLDQTVSGPGIGPTPPGPVVQCGGTRNEPTNTLDQIRKLAETRAQLIKVEADLRRLRLEFEMCLHDKHAAHQEIRYWRQLVFELKRVELEKL